jgi:hypothetical protein
MRARLRALVIVWLMLSISSCKARSEVAELNDLRKANDRLSQQCSSLESLVRLDVSARSANNVHVLERVERVKRLITGSREESAFGIAATVVDHSEREATDTLAVVVYNARGDVDGIGILDRTKGIIAAGQIPSDVTRPSVPCWRFFVTLRTVTRRPETGFIDHNVLEIASGQTPVYVAIRRSDGGTDAIPVQSRQSLEPGK